MSKCLTLLACFLFIFSSCGKRVDVIEVKDENGNIKEKYYLDKDSLKFGTYTSYDEKGNIFEESHFKNGVLNGERIIFFPSGEKEIVENYENGIFNGPYSTFYNNGQLNLVANYIEGDMEGLVKRYYDTGELMEEVSFVNSEENGPFKEYYKNGTVKWIGEYENGDNEIGIIQSFNEEGELIKKMNCGKYLGDYMCQTIWTVEEGEKELVFEYEE